MKFYTPHLLLQDFVNCIMVIHVKVDASNAPVICPYPPTPQNSIFFYIDDLVKMQTGSDGDFLVQPKSVVVGPQLTRVSIDINQSHKAVRVGFHPGGLARMLGISLSGMIDKSYDAEDVFGPNIKQLNIELQEADTFDEIHQLIEAFLLQQVSTLQKSLPFDQAMLELLRSGGNTTMEDIASIACLSLRQFERVSKDRLGMSPKLFARITRFSKAYRLRENFTEMSWTNIAYSCGYFDQMHMIRDFKVFAGVAPGVIEQSLHNSDVRLQASLRL